MEYDELEEQVFEYEGGPVVEEPDEEPEEKPKRTTKPKTVRVKSSGVLTGSIIDSETGTRVPPRTVVEVDKKVADRLFELKSRGRPVVVPADS